MEADRPHATRAAGGLAVVFIDIDKVDVRRHVQLTRAELAHADDPEVDALAPCVQRRAVAFIGLDLRLHKGQLQRCLGQVRHAAGDSIQRRGFFDVQHRQPFQHQLARHAQSAGQVAARGLQSQHQRGDGLDTGHTRWQQRQFSGVTPTHTLHEAAVPSPCTARSRRGGRPHQGLSVELHQAPKHAPAAWVRPLWINIVKALVLVCPGGSLSEKNSTGAALVH